MTVDIKRYFHNVSKSRWSFYLIRAYVVVLILFALSHAVAFIPAQVIFALWAILSAVSAVGTEYRVVIRKLLKQHKYKAGGKLAEYNNGRLISLIICFILSAICIASMLIEITRWNFEEWLLIIAAIPLFIAIYSFVNKRVIKEVELEFQKAETIKFTYIVMTIVIVAVYFIIVSLEPSFSYKTVEEAIQAANNPLAQSSSVLLSDIGKLISLSNGFTAYGISIVSGASFWVSVIIRLFVCVAALYGMINLLGMLLLSKDELKSVFLPLESLKEHSNTYKLVKGHIALAVLLPILLTGGMIAVDNKVDQLSKTEEYQAIEESIEEQIEAVVYVVDGKYFDQKFVNQLQATTRTKVKEITEEYRNQVVSLVNKMYDQQIENVDSYLDWYYSPSADYELLLQFLQQLSGKAVEDAMSQQFEETINNNIDTTELDALRDNYVQQMENIKNDYWTQLDEREIKNVEDLSFVSEIPIDSDYFTEPFDLSQNEIDKYDRVLGIPMGAAAGIGTKILTKPFFNTMVSKLTTALGARGLLTAGGAVVGNAVGVVASLGVGVVTDFLLLKTDELINRDKYKQEIIACINESRNETLEEIQGQ
ncbi:hypothetical protein [Adlercreutzia sp. ZJ304]|uniref:hypothetical protein n=1 Tax=Adlercreutzia sp. ZJ304 TaxID=2709791 RepID=UPI0013ED3D8A|nr:hypothetical protein [Adlercreutzia sp. ZJ304]